MNMLFLLNIFRRLQMNERKKEPQAVNLNNSLRKMLLPYCVDYLGFADLSGYQTELIKFGGNIVKGYQSGISIGLVIPDSIVDFLPERADINVACEYRTHGYEVLNDRLNLIASVVSSYLNREGHRTLPVAVADRTDAENAIPTVSHKMIAHIAGLGWIGKNCLLITPEHGPRLRLISVLTNAPLEAVDNPLAQRCGECRACVKICPVKAIKGKNYKTGEPREARFEFIKCHNYFENLKATQEYAVCGMCLYACPHGKTKSAAAL
jgi:epoxyqueuosine reductase QueG